MFQGCGYGSEEGARLSNGPAQRRGARRKYEWQALEEGPKETDETDHLDEQAKQRPSLPH